MEHDDKASGDAFGTLVRQQRFQGFMAMTSRVGDLCTLAGHVSDEQADAVAVAHRVAEARVAKVDWFNQIAKHEYKLTAEALASSVTQNVKSGLQIAAVVVLFAAVEELINGLIQELPRRFPNRILRQRLDETVTVKRLIDDGIEQIKRNQIVAWTNRQLAKPLPKKLQLLYDFIPPPELSGQKSPLPTPADADRLALVRNDAAHKEGGLASIADLPSMHETWSTGGLILCLWVQEHIDGKFELFDKVCRDVKDE